MSQSPTAEVRDPDQQYLDAWRDLAVRIQQGQSFSGRERNCCFLNTHGQRFADVSSAMGLDQIDDCRAISMVDWDHDGDLDIIQANRTGPRVRFLENRFASAPRTVSLRLIGDPAQRCNRDAIGARVQLTIDSPGGKSSVLTRTVYAGDAFVSQSSKWLHFGVPTDATISSVRIRWPGTSDWKPVSDVSTIGRFVVDQASNKAEMLASRAPVTLATNATDVPVEETEANTARVVLPRPEVVLPLRYHPLSATAGEPTAAGTSEVIASNKNVLLVMWAPWCQPCLQELAELAANAENLKAANIEIVAISVDSVSEDFEEARNAAIAYWEKEKLPFRMGLADEESLRRISGVWQAAMYRKRQLPIPSSFLVDARGRLRVVYTGRVATEKLVADVANLDIADDQIHNSAVPLPGRWAESLFVTNPIAIASIFREELQFDDAQEYLTRYQKKNPAPDNNDVSEEANKQRRRFADVCYHLGKIAMDQKQFETAIARFDEALTYNRRMAPALFDRAFCLQQMGKTANARQAFQEGLRLDPRNHDAWNQLGVLYLSARENENAAKCFERALRVNPRAFSAANNLAWLRATAREPNLRNGEQAVRLAKQLADGPGANRADVLDTLAAAQAEAGDFNSAIKSARRAIALATEHGNSGLATRIGRRLKLYVQSRPYHED